MSLKSTIFSLAVLAASAASAAFAADAPAPAALAASGAVAEACRQDMQTMCAGMQPGDGKLMACMKDNRSKLSSGCKSAIRAQRASRKAVN